jgi:hypothetical protein
LDGQKLVKSHRKTSIFSASAQGPRQAFPRLFLAESNEINDLYRKKLGDVAALGCLPRKLPIGLFGTYKALPKRAADHSRISDFRKDKSISFSTLRAQISLSPTTKAG